MISSRFSRPQVQLSDNSVNVHVSLDLTCLEIAVMFLFKTILQTRPAISIPANSNRRFTLIFERQWLHGVALFVLLSGCYWATGLNGVDKGELWGVESISWYWVAVIIPVMHQVYVWLCWRNELHFGLLTRLMGNSAFPAYATGFAILGISRVLTVFILAYANRGSFLAESLPMKAVAFVMLLPALYLFYSVKRYFSFRRALGADHFDPAVGNMPFVRKGIFRFTSNGMYVFGFFLLWVPALWWASSAALVVALFNHLYIWVHYFATERPDIRHIYNDQNAKQNEQHR